MSARKSATAARAAAALPPAEQVPATAGIDAARERAEELHRRLAFELSPVLAGLATLTNALRVLEAFDMRASLDPAFAESLWTVCGDWCDPLAHPTEDIVADLARFARWQAVDLVELASAHVAAARE